MRINNNLAALNAWRNLTISGENMQKSLQRLSSGYRINKAADDAAGLAVSEKMKAQIRGLSMALRNTQDGISLLQTAEGGAAKIQDMLQRMRELAVQASSGSLQNPDRAQLQNEFEELAKEINRTARSTTFNNQSLINGGGVGVQATGVPGVATVSASGSYTGSLTEGAYTLNVSYSSDTNGGTFTFTLKNEQGTNVGSTITVPENDWHGDITLDGITYSIHFAEDPTKFTNPTTIADVTIGHLDDTAITKFHVQVGANSGDGITFDLAALNAKALGLTTTSDPDSFDPVNAGDKLKEFSIKTRDTAENAIDMIDQALDMVTSARAKMGAYQNRLEATVSTLQTQYENLTAAESRIRDVDMAQEMAEFTKYQILQQAGTAMLAQANQLPQSILSLLR